MPTTATIATLEPFVKPRTDSAARLEAAQPIAELTPGASVTRNQGGNSLDPISRVVSKSEFYL
jgi:hypothetical protein